jgi:putative hemolysin
MGVRIMRYLMLFMTLFSFSVFANDTGLEKACQQAGGEVIQSEAELSTKIGYTKGLQQEFCFIEKDNRSMMIGLKTLGSKRPSIAATYLLRGLDLESLPKSNSPNPATDVCHNIGGSVIAYYTSGGMTNKYGQSGVCVFGDGSQVSTWSIIYITLDESYMGLRKSIQSKPLALDLPYIA